MNTTQAGLALPEADERQPVALPESLGVPCYAVGRDDLPCENWANWLLPLPGGFWIGRCNRHRGRKI